MKKLSEPITYEGENAYGQTHTHTRQYFQIEACDKNIPHWLGHNRPAKKVYAKDISKKVCRYSDATGWICYSFASGESAE